MRGGADDPVRRRGIGDVGLVEQTEPVFHAQDFPHPLVDDRHRQRAALHELAQRFSVGFGRRKARADVETGLDRLADAIGRRGRDAMLEVDEFHRGAV